MKIDIKDFFTDEVNDDILKPVKSEELEKNNVHYNEEVLIDTLASDFSYQIRERGEEYYYDGNVEGVYKNNNQYIAKVCGNAGKSYDVKIVITDENTADYTCTCPCDYPCKHEYAVIMAIANFEYLEVELKPQIREKESSIKEIIEKIPAEELKNYMLSPKGIDNVVIEIGAFSEHFRKYYPKQSYEFYYNNLYNDLVLDNNCIERVALLIDKARQYLSGNDFEEVFKIVKSIIEAYNDSNRLNFDNYVFDVINKLGMILRITWRKSLDETKEEIREWISELKNNAYYNNYYLEDMVISLDVIVD